MKVPSSFRISATFGFVVLALSFPVRGIAEHIMDAQIGRSAGVYLGDNLYNTLAGQTISLRRERSETFFFRMQHDLEFTNATSLGSAVVRIRGNYARLHPWNRGSTT